ncbi:MAG TPA: condensation domain-containing protein, partial [Thermoanaerobaculia bacterium]|nr:condensation domain-containing protein [Thermoanaerobaculia bacterium]
MNDLPSPPTATPRPPLGSVLERLRAKREAALPTRIPHLPRATGSFPLSFGQQRLWLVDQLQGGTAAYNVVSAVRLAGPLDVAALRAAFTAVVDRHEILRTTFRVEGETPVQVVAPPDGKPLPLPLADLTALANPAAEMASVAQEVAGRPFALDRGPLLRILLLCLRPGEHVLVVVLHHIVSDGWSVGVLLRETAALYGAFAAEEPAGLAELPVQYADFAVWQRRELAGEVLEQQLAHWRAELGSEHPVLQLPADRPRPPVLSLRGAQHPLALSRELTAALEALGRSEGVTLFVLLLAGYQVLLHRLSHQHDIRVGTAIANRKRREVQDLIGFFANTLVMRVEIPGDVGFRALLRQVHEAAMGAYAHQDLPFERLVEELQPERHLSHAPLFQAAFAYQNVPLPAWRIAELAFSLLELDSGAAMFDLMLDLQETPAGLKGWFQYSTDLFDGATVARFAAGLEALLTGIVAAPGSRLSALPLLSPAERHQLVEWSGATRVYPGHGTLAERVAAQAARTPGALAVAAGEVRLTYRELDLKANQAAWRLRALGVGPGSRVGLCLERSPDLVVALLAVLKAGAAYVPIDPGYPAERVRFMLENARVAALVTSAGLLERLPAEGIPTLCLDRDRELLARLGTAEPPAAAGIGDLLYIIYTSGSTGRPKGTGIFQNAFSNLVDWYVDEFSFGPEDRILLISSFSFDLTQKNYFAPLVVGGELHLAAPEYDPAALVATLARERV